MTVKTEAARDTLTYSRMRGMVAILIGECRNTTGLLGYARWKVLKVPDQTGVRGVGCYKAV